jgi:acetyltransferase
MTVVESPSQASPLLLAEWSAQLETRSGVKLNVRPAAPEDEARLVDFFGHVAADDLRFRFLSPVRHIGHALAQELLAIDHTTTENFLAFDAGDGMLVATAMLAAEPDLARAEVAVAIRSDYKHRGVGWTLLRHVSDYAAARGIKRLESIECCDNREAISLEREMGFTARPYPGDATLTLVVKDLAPLEEA